MASLALAAALLAVSFAMPQHVEDALVPYGVHVQEDGGKPGDAPDLCEAAEADRGVALEGIDSAGILIDQDDTSDAYTFLLNDTTVGQRVSLSMLTGAAVQTYDVAFDILAPGCGSSVLDPDSPYYSHQDDTPYQPGPGEAAFDGDASIDPSSCSGTGWKVLVNQLTHGLKAPDTIFVAWTDGSTAYVPLTKASQGTVGMYLTDLHTDVTVARMVIVLPASWHGHFQITECPAGVQPGAPPAPTAQPGYAEFTVQEAGTHVIRVFITRGIVDKTVGTVQDTVANPPTTIAANCHRDICQPAVQFVSYDLDGAFVPQNT